MMLMEPIDYPNQIYFFQNHKKSIIRISYSTYSLLFLKIQAITIHHPASTTNFSFYYIIDDISKTKQKLTHIHYNYNNFLIFKDSMTFGSIS